MSSVPEPVRMVASSSSDAGLPPSIRGVRRELEAGDVCRASLLTLSMLHAVSLDPDPAVGGAPGARWVAGQVPGLQTMMPSWVHDWATGILAAAGPEVWHTAAAGEMRPSILVEWDRGVELTETSWHSGVVGLVMDALRRTARLAGLKVVGYVGDPVLRKRLESVDICDVACEANLIEVKGQTLWRRANVDINEVVDRQATDLRDRVRELVAEFKEALIALGVALFGATPFTSPLNEGQLVEQVVTEFREAAVDIPARGLPQSVTGAVTRSLEVVHPSGVGPGALREIVVAATGDDVPARARELLDVIQNGRAQLRIRRRFRHGYHKRSESPHPEHVRIDGWLEIDVPNVGWGLWPGDHKSCGCAWTVESALSVQ